MEKEMYYSISTESFKSKPKKRITYEPLKMSIEDFYNKVVSGHSYYFLHKKGITFQRVGIQKEIYGGTNIISIDVDKHINEVYNSPILLEKLYNHLKGTILLPTFMYTSFSNLEEPNRHRYRLIYIFDEYLSDREHREISRGIYNEVQTKICEWFNLDAESFEIDKKSYSPLQYFNGTNRELPSQADKFIGISFKKEYFDSIRVTEIDEYEDLEYTIPWDESILTDMQRLSFKEFAKEYSKEEYQLIFRTEPIEYNEDGYAVIDKDEFYKIPKYSKRVKDKEHRKNKLYCNTLVRRLINKDATPMDLLFSLKYDLEYNIDNSDFGISFNTLIAKVQEAMAVPYKEIEKKLNLDLYRSKTKKDKVIVFKRELTSKYHYQTLMSKAICKLIDSYYDHRKTIKDNVESINKIIADDDKIVCNEISKTTIESWLKKHKENIVPKSSIKLKVQKLSLDGLTIRQIENQLKKEGFKTSKSTIQRWLSR